MNNGAEGRGDTGPPCPVRGARYRLISGGAAAETEAAPLNELS